MSLEFFDKIPVRILLDVLFVDFLKVVRLVFWSGVVGPGTNDFLSLAARQIYGRNFSPVMLSNQKQPFKLHINQTDHACKILKHESCLGESKICFECFASFFVYVEDLMGCEKHSTKMFVNIKGK